jgi:hypothetical protein
MGLLFLTIVIDEFVEFVLMVMWIHQPSLKVKGEDVSCLPSSTECCICQGGEADQEPLQSFCSSLYHVAHSSCMTRWYVTQSKSIPTCPICRQPLMAKLCYDFPLSFVYLRNVFDWKRIGMRSSITFFFLLSSWTLLGRRWSPPH